MRRSRTPLHINAAAALAGLVAAGVILAVGTFVGRLIAPQTGPFLVVGNAIVDLTPEWLKSFAIETFGENDKLVLLGTLGVVLAGLALVAGLLQLHRPPLGIVVGLGLGAVAILAALNRPGADASYAVPTIAGVVAGGLTLWFLVKRLRELAGVAAAGQTSSSGDGASSHEDAVDAAAGLEGLAAASDAGRSGHESAAAVDEPRLVELRGADRRQFLLLTAGAAGLALVAALGSQRVGQTLQDVMEARARITLPTPSQPLGVVPAGVELDVPDITPFVSSNDDFYRVDTALEIPRVDPNGWELRIHGLVEREVRLSYNELINLPLTEAMITLTCVSNQIGGDLADNAVWLGYPLRELLERAAPTAEADMVLSRSIDGFSASTPLEVLTDGRDALLAIGMNGEPLPLSHGFPVRMVVPGLYGYVSATKWIVEMEVTRFDRATAYWTDRDWAPRGPIKTASRIDVPASFANLNTGPNIVAGVAWAQHRGISRVEVSVDGGPWNEADLSTEASVDTWRQWSWEWDAEPGNHTLRVRATDSTGETQTSEQQPPFPSGATGWHSRAVEVV